MKTEIELAEKVLTFFTDWEIYPEVPCQGGSIDILALKGPVVMATEAKMKINFTVIEQAFRNRAHAHFSYVAVPKPKTLQPFFLRVCREFGIGVLFVNETGDQVVSEVVKPKFNRNIRKLKLEPWMKNSISGSLHGRETAYSFAIKSIVMKLKRSNGRMSIPDIFKETVYHWSSLSSAKQCILSYIGKGIIKNIKHDKGYLVLVRSINLNEDSNENAPRNNKEH